ncbi:MAG: hypothetical protein K2N15_03600 [Lachnospiraceae bacterium]|nr:hypothetical protein [Lachnospiraceae bacterium]
MERLTEKELFMGAISYNCRGHEIDCSLNCPNEDSCGWLKEALEKLKQYEDLEERLCAVYGECDGMLEMVIEHLECHENADIPEPVFKARLLTDGMVDRWEEYKSLEAQGKLLKLPCAVGDTVYEICEGFIEPCTVEVIFLADYKDRDGNQSYMMEIHYDREDCPRVSTEVYFTDIGKTVFLTQEEADAALEKMEESK